MPPLESQRPSQERLPYLFRMNYPMPDDLLKTHIPTIDKKHTEKGGKTAPYHEGEVYLELCPEERAFQVVSGIVGNEATSAIASEDADDSYRVVFNKLITIAATRFTLPKNGVHFTMSDDNLEYVTNLTQHVFDNLDAASATVLLDGIITAEFAPQVD